MLGAHPRNSQVHKGADDVMSFIVYLRQLVEELGSAPSTREYVKILNTSRPTGVEQLCASRRALCFEGHAGLCRG